MGKDELDALPRYNEVWQHKNGQKVVIEAVGYLHGQTKPYVVYLDVKNGVTEIRPWKNALDSFENWFTKVQFTRGAYDLSDEED